MCQLSDVLTPIMSTSIKYSNSVVALLTNQLLVISTHKHCWTDVIYWVTGVRIILKDGSRVLSSRVVDDDASIDTGLFGSTLRITLNQLDGAIGLGVSLLQQLLELH